MKYFEVELENPDEFLKLQTEDFVMKKTSSYPLNLASNWKYESHSITFILNISSFCVIL